VKVTAKGIEIHYALEGDGPVVTLSHALGTNLSMWDEQARALTGRYRVLRFDTRGHGQTTALVSPYTLDQMADDLRGLLAGLGITGDLFESLLKRSAGVKDSSHLIPGHGGILDRIDALLLVVPGYYIFLLILN